MVFPSVSFVHVQIETVADAIGPAGLTAAQLRPETGACGEQ